jgi:hypothetical protein
MIIRLGAWLWANRVFAERKGIMIAKELIFNILLRFCCILGDLFLKLINIRLIFNVLFGQRDYLV